MSRRVFRATVCLLSTKDGGRSGAIASGYRSLVRFDRSDLDFGVEVVPESGVLSPGERGVVSMSFWVDDAFPDVSASTAFELREGTRVVGIGTILGAQLDEA